MLRYAADESFNDDILRGLRRRDKALDRVRVQDVGLSGAADPDILAWVASKGRIALTHDVQTMVGGVESRYRITVIRECLLSRARTSFRAERHENPEHGRTTCRSRLRDTGWL